MRGWFCSSAWEDPRQICWRCDLSHLSTASHIHILVVRLPRNLSCSPLRTFIFWWSDLPQFFLIVEYDMKYDGQWLDARRMREYALCDCLTGKGSSARWETLSLVDRYLLQICASSTVAFLTWDTIGPLQCADTVAHFTTTPKRRKEGLCENIELSWNFFSIQPCRPESRSW